MSIPLQKYSHAKPSGNLPMKRIDAHHHLWRYHADEFGWIGDEMAVLRRDFLVDELRREMLSAGIDGAVAVQARESLEETCWLLECAQSAPFLRGVVGWVPLEANNLQEILSRFQNADKLVGFREIVQGKPDEYLDRAAFNRGIKHLTELNFTYDILIHERQLLEAIRFVDQHPNQIFVLDHAAKPKIAMNELEPWKTHIYEIARRPNVSCKLSGLVTEAYWQAWTPESLQPYFDICVDAFGTNRLLAGSDWPVCLVACTYSRWWDLLVQYFAGFSENEVQHIFGENAMAIYRLAPFECHS